jgi:superoxide dismutase, Cu-Zn family
MKKLLSLSLMVIGLSARAWAATGIAEVRGTASGSSVAGTVRFEDTPPGLKVSASLTGVPAGLHAFHIHEFGSCADSGKAAGSHYNPLSAPHGEVMKAGMQHAHAGDLGNITAGTDGKASLEAVIPGVTLAAGPYTVGGRAVILHEKVDDFSQPAGNAGGRIGCGAIVITGGAAGSGLAPLSNVPPVKK